MAGRTDFAVDLKAAAEAMGCRWLVLVKLGQMGIQGLITLDGRKFYRASGVPMGT